MNASINEFIAKNWDDLSSDGQRRALRKRAVEADVTAEWDASPVSWKDNLDGSEDYSWPSYTLSVSVNEQEIGKVEGWVCYDLRDGSTSLSDGSATGTPRVSVSDLHEICGGENTGSSLTLPLLDSGGRALVYNEGHIDAALESAASDVVVEGPSLEDFVPENCKEEADDVPGWVITNGRIQVYRCMTTTKYGITVFAIAEADLDASVSKYNPTYVTGVHGSIRDAWTAVEFDDITEGAPDLPEFNAPSLVLTQNFAEVSILIPVSLEPVRNTYHLNDKELARVLQHGWAAILDDLRKTFSLRLLLDFCKAEHERLDAKVLEVDPLVDFEDSIHAGNCQRETERTAQALSTLGPDGHWAPVKASVLLAFRDDAYSRAACRMALLKIEETQKT